MKINKICVENYVIIIKFSIIIYDNYENLSSLLLVLLLLLLYNIKVMVN
jgi:hypothetical protein